MRVLIHTCTTHTTKVRLDLTPLSPKLPKQKKTMYICRRFDDDATWHPEIAAQLWGEARCQVLAGRRRVDGRSLPFGALQIDPEQLIGIQGDAIYTTEIQPWTLPTRQGGMDDGENGRIRIKGYLQGPMPAPQTIDERHVLSDRAEEAGWA